MSDDEFVDDRPRFQEKESRQTGLRDGFMRYKQEKRLDEAVHDE